MFKLLSQAVETALELKSLTQNVNHCEIVVAPVFVHLKTLADKLQDSNIRLAAQNCAAEIKHSANTGEVAADMLRDVGTQFCIAGHSERRQFYGETDEIVNQKTVAVLAANLTAIVCVGETLGERDAGQALATVERQLAAGLRNLTTADMKRIIIAYEPVWAIGTGQTAAPAEAQEMHRFIRRSLEQTHSSNVAEETRILYGGSVKPENIRELMAQTDIDGALIGGASLDAKSFARIVNYNDF